MGTGTLSYSCRTRFDPEQRKHAQWVTCLVSMQAMEELGHFQLPETGHRYGMLKHEVMAVDE